MQALLVNLDLKEPSKDYSGLFQALKQDSWWWHHLKGTWIVVSQRDAAKLVQTLRPHLLESDRLLVVPIASAKDVDGILPLDAWRWLDEHVK